MATKGNENLMAAASYLLGFVTGIIFLLIEKQIKDKTVIKRLDLGLGKKQLSPGRPSLIDWSKLIKDQRRIAGLVDSFPAAALKQPKAAATSRSGNVCRCGKGGCKIMSGAGF